jgi:acyl dehydratase
MMVTRSIADSAEWAQACAESDRELAGIERELPANWNDEPIAPAEVRRYAYGVGDYNPLYSDREYATKSRYEGVIAPPYFPLCINSTVSSTIPVGAQPYGPGKPEHIVFGGTDWAFKRVIRPGDVIRAFESFQSAEVKGSRYAGQTVVERGQVRYVNQADEDVAIAQSHVVRFLVAAQQEREKYVDAVSGFTFGPDDLERFEEARRSVKRRGCEVRFVEDTKIGDAISPIVQGPLLDGEIYVFNFSHRDIVGRNGEYRLYPRELGPSARSIEDMLEDDPWSHGHVTTVVGKSQLAEGRGFPAAFDIGMQRVCWMVRVVADWIGDEGDIVSHSTRLIRPNFVGGVTWYGGVVADKQQIGEDHFVDLKLTAKDQLDRAHTVGTATVRLPSRALRQSS